MAVAKQDSGIKTCTSARLNQLSLPNCHLVEAVLTDHYHVFNEDCRDRLKKLLDLITSVNNPNSARKSKSRYRRDTRKKKRNQNDQNEARDDSPVGRGDNEMMVIFKADERPEKEALVDPADCGDFLSDIKERIEGDELLGQVLRELDEEIQSTKGPKRQKGPTTEQTIPVSEPYKSPKGRDIPSLALRYYCILLQDMQQNCRDYERFAKNVILPIDVQRLIYMDAGYDCWMEYMMYIKNTLDYLQPYVLSLIQMCKQYKLGDPKLKLYETRMPRVLINSLKNMKPWRKALNETINNCETLLLDRPQANMKVNLHHLYLRYYQKMNSLINKECGE